MGIGGAFWADHFADVAIPQVQVLASTLRDRILPAFANIEQEAQDHAEEVYRELGNQPAFNDSVDMADLAEAANERGLARYEALTGVRQAIINALTVALHHMLEQELLFFLRRHVLHRSEEPDLSLAKLAILWARLRARGLEVEALDGWSKLRELGLVANTVKHADGRSADDLKRLRPDLFVPPELRTTRFARSATGRRVYRPASGNDLYVSQADFEEYTAAAEHFLRAFADAIR
jgi:hypothetical protein